MPDPVSTLLLFVGAYLVGSIPVAFIVVRVTRGGDLRQMGSSNIGAMNAYEVTHSRRVGLTIGFLDTLKGAAAVILLPIAFRGPGDPFLLQSIALIGVVAGHNYNLWLSIGSRALAGGKGLAAAGGGLLIFMTWLVPIWAGLYAVGLLLCQLWRGERNIIIGNVFALLTLPVPGYFIYGWAGVSTSLIVVLFILPKHVKQVRELLVRPPA